MPLASALGLSDPQLAPLRVLKSLRLARVMRLLESFSELNTLALVIYVLAFSLTMALDGAPRRAN